MPLRLSHSQQSTFSNAAEMLLSPDLFATESDWHAGILRALMPLTGAYKSAIRSPEPGGFKMTPLGFEQTAIDEHRDYYHQFDFGRALGSQPTLGTVFSRNECYGPELPRFRQTEYYCDYIAKYKVFDALCLSTVTENHVDGTVLYLWHERDLSEERRRTALGMLRLLAPAFKAGIAVGNQVHQHHLSVLALLDGCVDGCALFSDGGKLMHRNAALERMLGSDGDGTLSKVICEYSFALQRPGATDAIGPMDTARVSGDRPVGTGNYSISACFLGGGHGGGRSILVTVRERAHYSPGPVNIAEVRARFGLTHREAEVVLMLVARRTTREIASGLGVSEHTARHHTENLLRKLGVSSRTEVSKVILANPRTL